jgi:NADH-quinone oxidoreductase subunit I
MGCFGKIKNSMIGSGILKGMAVTARNFVGSYFEKERLITVQYPEERSPLPENYRNFPFLPYDGDDPHAGLRCVACKICEKECPPQCIYIIKSDDKKPDYMGKPQFYPAVFDIDISVCMSCQICVEVCPFEAIKMDKDFELSKRERFDALLLRKAQLSKSNEYYHKIHPVEAAAVDKNLADAVVAAEAKKKAAAEAAAKAAAAKAAATNPAPVTTSSHTPEPTAIASPASATGSTSSAAAAPLESTTSAAPAPTQPEEPPKPGS